MKRKDEALVNRARVLLSYIRNHRKELEESKLRIIRELFDYLERHKDKFTKLLSIEEEIKALELEGVKLRLLLFGLETS